MKNIVHILVMGFIALVITIGIMGVTGRNIREKEQTESLSQAMSETIRNMSMTGDYTIDNEEEFKADFVEGLVDKLNLSGVSRVNDGDGGAVFGDRDMVLQVDFAKADSENELLMVHVKERFSYALGIEGVAENSAVVLFSEEDRVNLHSISYTMTYEESRLYNCAPDYKSYEQEEYEHVKTPASPTYFEDYDPDNPYSETDETDFDWLCVASTNETEISEGELLAPYELRKRLVKGDYTFAFQVSDRDRKVIAWMNGEKAVTEVPYQSDILPYLDALSPESYAPEGYTFIGWSRTMAPTGWSGNDVHAPEGSAIKAGEVPAGRSNRNYYAMYARDTSLSISYDGNGGSATASAEIPFRDVAVSRNLYNGGEALNKYYYTYNGIYAADCPRIWSDSRYAKMQYRVAGAPSRAYYYFDYWMYGSGSYAANTLFSFAGVSDDTLSITFRAHWTPIPYRITIVDTGRNAIAPITYNYNVESRPFQIYVPTKKYYTFSGWSGSGVNGGSTLNISPGVGSMTAGGYGINNAHGNITINASFVPITYYVSIDGRVTYYTVESGTFYISPSFMKPTGDGQQWWTINASQWQRDEWGPAAWGFWGYSPSDRIPVIPGVGSVYSWNYVTGGYNVIGNAHGNYVLYTY